MQSGFYWKNWSSPYREIYIGLLVLFAACLGALLYAHFISDSIGWSVIAQSEPVEMVMETFKIGPFSLQTTADSQVFSQKFTGNFSEVQVASYYTFLIVTVLCFILLMAIVTQLPRFWYFVGTSLFVVALVNMKFELLLLFGSTDKVGLIIALILFLPVSYWFNSIKTEITLATRIIVFLGLTVLLGIIIAFAAEVPSPFLYLASYSMLNPLLISLVFVLMISHEIIAAFIYLLTKTQGGFGGKNLQHFSVITTIYLSNLLLAYLHETRLIDWNILYIDLFLLLGISTTIGLWGYALREPQYQQLFSFRPTGALFYIAMASCCFVTLGHFVMTGNDPAVEVFRDFILYGHLGYGLIFTLYILANFLDPLKQNMQVFKVLYKPLSMPYFTFRLAGLIAFIAFLVKSNWEVPVNQGFAAYYNGLGDLHRYNNDLLLARHFYEEGAIFGYNNHKSNYELASIAHSEQDADAAIARYTNATRKNPSPQSFVNLSNIYSDKDRFFDALFTLQEAKSVFPDNGQIVNNLGLLYAKINILDTAALYIDQATSFSDTEATASSNILTLLALNDLPIHPDSVLAEYTIRQDPLSINNLILLKNKLGLATSENYLPPDSVLSFLQASLLYNTAYNYLFREDSIPTNLLRSYSRVAGNDAHSDRLLFVAALNQEKDQQVNGAFRQLNWLANANVRKAGEYFNLLGLWALKYDVPYVAVDYFSWAAENGFSEAMLNRAIALTEDRRLPEALSVWNELVSHKDRNVQLIATNMLELLALQAEQLENDRQRYYYLRYKADVMDTTLMDQIIEQIQSDDYKAQAIFDRIKAFWRIEAETEAIRYYGELANLEITDKALYTDIQWFELKMLAAQGNIRGLAAKINQGIVFDQAHQVEKHFYTGLLNEASGDTLKARENYEWVAYRNPFFAESVIAAANFIGLKDPFEGYRILLNAVELNPRSIRLLKAYILQCARIENTSYAEISLSDLRPLLSADEYRDFKNTYDQLLQKVKEEAENF